MDAEAELTVRACVAEARIRLDKAAGIARAADACAGAGFSDKAVEITLDIEQPLYEATTLLNAVSLTTASARAADAQAAVLISAPPSAFAGSGSCRR